jgi:hypothetical protein
LTSNNKTQEGFHPGFTSLEVVTHPRIAKEDREYWFSRTPLERLQHLERLREMNYGREVVEQRLQRVFAVFEREKG